MELKIPFEELKKTSSTIKHLATQTIINEFISIFEEKAIAFNEDAVSPITSPTSLREQAEEWQGLISTFTEKVKAAAGDKTSERRALDIIKKIEECCRPVIQQLAEPLSPVSKPFTYWQEHRLRLEQQLLLNDVPLAKAFAKALSEIDRFGSRNYTLPNGIFICYAWPDAQDEREQHLKWIQPFLVGLRQHLRAAGLATAKLDIKDNPPGGNIYEYMKGAETADFVLLIGTESLLRKHEKGVSAICTELININRKRTKDRETGKYRVLPLLISGDYRDSFPAHYELYTTVKDWKGTKTYFQHLRWLIATLYSTREEAFTATWEEEFLKKISKEERQILEEGLEEKTVLAKVEKEKAEQAKAKEQKKVIGNKLLGLEGDSEMIAGEPVIQVMSQFSKKEQKEGKAVSTDKNLLQSSSGTPKINFEIINKELIAAKSNYFCGRVEILGDKDFPGKIEKCLRSKNNRINIFLLCGPSGSGKTQTAIQYGVKNLAEFGGGYYNCVAKLSATGIVDFIDDYIRLFEKVAELNVFSSDGARIKYTHDKKMAVYINNKFKELVSVSAIKILLIIDNVYDYKIIEYLPTDVGNIDIIITSNIEYKGHKIPRDNIVELSELSNKEALDLVRNIFGSDRYLKISEELLNKFISIVGKIPLSIVVCSYSIQNDIVADDKDGIKAMENFVKELKAYDLSLVKRVKSYIDDEETEVEVENCYKNIYFCLESAIVSYREEGGYEGSLRLLTMLSLLGRSSPKVIFKKCFAPYVYSDSILMPLSKRALITNYENYIEVQPLVSSVFFDYIVSHAGSIGLESNNTKKTIERTLVNVLNMERKSFDLLSTEGKFQFLIRFIQLNELAKLNPFHHGLKEVNFLYELTIGIIDYYYKIEHWVKFNRYLKLIVGYYEKVEGILRSSSLESGNQEYDLLLADVLNKCGLICIDVIEKYTDSPDYDDIYEFGSRVITKVCDIRRKYLSESDEKVSMAKNNLAVLNIVTKNYDQAEGILKQMVSHLTEHKEKGALSEVQTYRLAKTYDSLGLSYLGRKNYQSAIDNYSKSILVYSELKSEEPRLHYLLPFTYTQRGKVYYELAMACPLNDVRKENLVKAYEDFKKSINLHCDFSGKHENVRYSYPDGKMQNYVFLSQILGELNKVEELQFYCIEGVKFIKNCHKANGFQFVLDGEAKKLEKVLATISKPEQAQVVEHELLSAGVSAGDKRPNFAREIAEVNNPGEAKEQKGLSLKSTELLASSLQQAALVGQFGGPLAEASSSQKDQKNSSVEIAEQTTNLTQNTSCSSAAPTFSSL